MTDEQLLSDPEKDYKIHGEVAPGFEGVVDRYKEIFEQGIEKNSQMCIYYKGKKVVDVWGEVPGYRKDSKFCGDTLMDIFSSGKNLGAIMMAILHDKGLLDYSAKVATYWPEFAQNGKEDITVADVLRHEGMLEKLDKAITLDEMQTENVKKNSIGSIIEKQRPHHYGHGGKRCYHAVSKDWITNEIFRRIEPEGRTMGEYFQSIIQPKLDVGVYLKMGPETFDQCMDLADLPMDLQMANGELSFSNGRYASYN